MRTGTRDTGRWLGSTSLGLVSIALLGSCSSSSGPSDDAARTAERSGGAASEDVVAVDRPGRELLESLRARYRISASPLERNRRARLGRSAHPVIADSNLEGFERRADRIVPRWAPEAARPVELSLPKTAAGHIALTATRAPLAIRVQLERAARAEMVDAGGIALYRDALGQGHDWIQRAYASGVEDFVYFRTPPSQPEVSYRVDVSTVAGLRLVDGRLEFLDESGTPRLRMTAPFMATDAGTVGTRIDVEGCDVSRDARPPWGRPVTEPGASSCRVTVSWDEAAVSYPALLDPTWAATGDMTEGREGHTSTLLADGRVLVTGAGWDDSSTADLFDPLTETFAATSGMGAGRYHHTATRLDDGRVLVIGMGDGTLPMEPDAEIYDPVGATWTPTADPLLDTRCFQTSHLLNDGRVITIGGAGAAGTLDTAEIFDPADGSFTATATPMASLREDHASVVLQDGRVLVTGGWIDGGGDIDGVELYDPAADTWTTLDSLADIRGSHVAGVLGDGRVIVTGGWDFATAEIFTPSTLTWDPPIATVGVHAWPAAVVLHSGAFMFMGGYDPFEYSDEVEIFDVGGDQFFQVERMLDERAEHEATVLDDGRVLVTGGGFPGEAADLFAADPAGTVCAFTAQCASGHCVDGVCCDTACDGECEACSADKKGSGDDGTCEPFASGTDPDDECTALPAETCGTVGHCDGSGQCAVQSAGTLCAVPTCAAGQATSFACDGAGTCVEDDVSCAPFGCAGGGCATTCSGDIACAEDAWCDDSDGSCQPDQDDGAACDRNEQCISGACISRVCAQVGGCIDERSFVDTDGSVIDCAPYACGQDGCLDSCNSVLECAEPNICSGDGKCVAASSSPEEDSGCSVASGAGSQTRGDVAFWGLLLALGVAVRRRRARRAAVAIGCGVVGASVSLLGCGSEDVERQQSADATAPSSAPAAASPAERLVDGLMRDYRLPGLSPHHRGGLVDRPALRPSEAMGFVRLSEGGLRPELGGARSPRASLTLPERANQPARLVDPKTGMRVAFTLLHAADVPAQDARGLLVYPSAMGAGTHLLHRPMAGGTEDFLVLPKPLDEPQVRYRLDLRGVAGLRLVEDVLELLDDAGTPRLRMSAPYIVSKQGTGGSTGRIPVRTAVQGCAFDDDPRGPWGRPVVAPGRDQCDVVLSWDPQIAYPALLDPAWTIADQLVEGRSRHTATLLSDGRVLLAGGTTNSAEIFDPATDTFAATGSMTDARDAAVAALLSNGQVVVAGSSLGTAGSVELYENGSFTFGPPMTFDHSWGAGALLQDGRLMVHGGYGDNFDLELFTPDPGGGGTWAPGATSDYSHTEHEMTVLQDGRVFVTGRCWTNFPKAEIYDPVGDMWTPQPDMEAARCGHTATLLADGRVMVAGGWDNDATILGSVQMFDPPVGPGQGTWSPVPSPGPRLYHDATVLLSGQVMFTGGWDANYDDIDAVVVYDPASNTFSPTVPMARKRAYHTATRLEDGRVLVAGGEDELDFVLDAELFTSSDLGEACTVDGDCASGICTDGVCCDTPCDGTCESCLASEKGSGSDGVCEPLAEGSLDASCVDEGEASCGMTGRCDAAGACAFYPAGTECGVRACSDGVVTSSECSGNGGCVQTTEACAPYACASVDACATECSGVEQCAAGTYCSGDGVCAETEGIGAACSEDAQCESGACVDGACGEPSSCTNEHTLLPAQGEAIDCSPYQCVDGGCLSTCESVLDCRSGHVCNADGVCVLPSQPSAADDDSGCAIQPAPASRARLPWLLGLLALVWRVRRRRSS